ncbi:MAG: MotA/TolQ/ExbB proton channel family protein [Cytophagales bacterium]|nr:MotA/TolQ/ExbB proton channel family protein [Cytophagales bacterium]MCA6368435.1 MotA/TolQ/ExbB proton channel family protein [Cytophagales bacterium]MCA6371755.1 MotA/TolQ/ExbB proton channel family protein [Cytophagales bacterium]MCA6376406.1 MotA/TolQ/ExbB proton channel family protein [Cytophagales bacterium]MCA6384954.1 MotA/TolQ/ExbB proton channel family protein [Cytophagales bacterium]
MLAISITELHNDGGIVFMVPLSILLTINIGLVIYSIFRLSQKGNVSKFIEAVRQIGVLAAAFGAASTILGLFQAFGALSEGTKVWPFQVIMGGMRVAVITAMYGLFIFCLSLLSCIILKLSSKNTVD